MPSPPDNVAAIILAAGQSSRFGSDKRRALCAPGENLLQRAIALAADHCDPVFVVMKPQDAPSLTDLLGVWAGTGKVTPVYAEHSAQGMGSSLADGLTALRRREDTDGRQFSGVLVMLADMPAIQSSTLARIVAAVSMDKIVLPCYQYAGSQYAHTGRRGHPVLFGRRWFSDLQALQGDRGGRDIISANSAACVELTVDDPGILLDMDRPEDLEVL